MTIAPRETPLAGEPEARNTKPAASGSKLNGSTNHPHGFGPRPDFDRIPDALKLDRFRWCLWKAKPKKGKPGKFDKVPSNGERPISTTQPDQWLTFEQARNLYEAQPSRFNGVGLLVPDDGSLVVADIDGSMEIPQGWPPTYAEYSPSGNGLRLIWTTHRPPERDITKPVEIYSGHAARFVTITGAALDDLDIVDDGGFFHEWVGPQPEQATTEAPENLPAIPDELPALDTIKGLNDDQRQFLLHGTMPEGRDDRSAYLYGIACSLYESGLDDGEVLGVLAYNYAMEVALDHRNGDRGKAMAHLWGRCQKARQRSTERVNDLFEDLDDLGAGSTRGGPDWWEKYTVDDEDIEAIQNAEFVIPELVVRGHLIAVVAEPNGGKTTIFAHLAGEMTQAGYEVTYVNADISAADAKGMFEQARQNGYRLLLPDMKPGLSMADVVRDLEALNASGRDLSNQIMIFDTLKKMVDVINKAEAKRLYQTLRGLTAKGATIIVLAHTNKYKGEDGKPIFEGTGDLRADVDELIYLDPEKRQDGSMLVSTRVDKCRARGLEAVTFEIAPDRSVKRLGEYVDIHGLRKRGQEKARYASDIEAIREAIRAGNHQQGEIAKYCSELGVGKNKCHRVLREFDGDDWRSRRLPENNTLYYELSEASEFDDLEG